MAIPKHHPVIGQQFGKLTVAGEPRKVGRFRLVLCVCDCGSTKEAIVCRLFSGEAVSCGCVKSGRAKSWGQANRKHGHSGERTPTYLTWRCMIQRCYYPKTKSFNRYGGRGITVCPEWMGENGFQTFLADMGERPNGMTLDRIDVDLGYTPENCRWSDWATQVANRDNKQLG